MKTILVAGGAGFIGTNLCKTLLQKGYHVIVVDNIITVKNNHLNELLGHPHFTFIQHDIIVPFPKEFQTFFQNLEGIYHLACPTGVPNLIPLAEEMLLTCALGTRNVLEIAKSFHVKLLFASSSEVYGNPTISPQDESYTGNVGTTGIRSPYEEGKRFAESLIAMYVRKYNIKAYIVRIFNTYGPYMDSSDTRVIPKFIHLMKQSLPLTIEGDGSQKRTFCYVDDLVNGLMLVMEKGKKGEVYNLGNNQSITIQELARLFFSLLEKEPRLTFIPRPHHDHDNRLPNITKIQQMGWKPTVSLKEGIQKTMQWYGL